MGAIVRSLNFFLRTVRVIEVSKQRRDVHDLVSILEQSLNEGWGAREWTR